MVSGTTALVATIGERDPDGVNRVRKGTGGGRLAPTGPLLAARRFRPRFALLLGTPAVRPALEATAAALAREAVEQVEQVELEGDAANFDDMSLAIDQVLQRYRDQLSKDVQVCAVISSGTPQMGQALLLAAMARLPRARFFQALDPRYVEDDERRLRPLDPQVLHLRLELERATEAARRGQWLLAAELFTRATQTEGRFADDVRRQTRAAGKLARCLHLAENFAFEQAAKAAKPDREDAFRRQLESISQWYSSIARGQGGTTRLPAELAALADRQLQAELGARACVTAAIAWETTLTVGLRTLGLDPDSIAENEISRIPHSMQSRLLPIEDRRCYRLEGQRARRELLEALLGAGPVTEWLRGHGEDVDRLTRIRNDLLHRGTSDRSPNDLTGLVENALRAIGELQRAFGWEPWAEAPTTFARVRELFDQIASKWATPAGHR